MTADENLVECSPLLRFPWKLHQMLNDSQETGAENIVSWLSHGRGFKVHESETFVKQVMARYFKQTKYKSFQRQLNMWGFERVTEGADKGSYCHDNFVKGQESLCAKMIRTKIKGTGIRKGSISSMVETAPQPPPLKRIVSLQDSRKDTTTADAGCASENNAALCAAEDEGMIMKAIFPKTMDNNRDQRGQEECWMGNSISSIIFEDDDGGQHAAERLASKRMGQQNQEERQSKRRRSSSICSIIFDGDGGAASSSFGGRSFFVVDDYNPPPHQLASSSSSAAQRFQQQQTHAAASLMKRSSSTGAASSGGVRNTSCENDRKRIQGLSGANSLVSMVSPPGASYLTGQEAELTNDIMLSALLSADQLFSHSSPLLHCSI